MPSSEILVLVLLVESQVDQEYRTSLSSDVNRYYLAHMLPVDILWSNADAKL